MPGVEFWSGVGRWRAAEGAQRAEAAGWDGIGFGDSQNLQSDCYIAMALAAQATTTLKVSTGVTNPFTRHAAVTASAIATVQGLSGGRAHLGIGRGDSAMAHLGYAPASVPAFEKYLQQLRGYLRRESVPFDEDATLNSLELDQQPDGSRIEWLRESQATVPVHVAATGPRVIRAAALYADAITLAVGADPARLRWGMDVAHEARAEAGLAPEIPFGAYLLIVVHDDPGTAIQLAAGALSVFARFSVMHGRPLGPVSATEREALTQIHDSYDMTSHTLAASSQANLLTDELAHKFGVFGPSSYCVERLSELIDLGLERIHVVGAAGTTDPNEGQRAKQRFVEEVLPALRERFSDN
jgi:5,10-methylenetetrahydromethanopterin reductase